MPYKDPYMEYLRQMKKRIEQGEHINNLHQIWRDQNRDKVRQQNNESKQRFKERHPELEAKQIVARRIAGKIPLKDYCELCPEDGNKRKKLNRHHFDYDYPTIFLTICTVCHRWATLEELYKSEKECKGNEHL
jgi:hypothetical protein